MLGKRLATARERAGLKQVELAVALGDRYDQAMISRVESGQKRLRFDGVTKAARELGVSLDYLAGLTDNPAPAAQLDKALAHERARVNEHWAGASHEEDDSDLVDRLTVAPAGGDGSLVDTEQVIGHIRFRRPWLRKHGLVARQCKVLSIRGKSMEPTLPDGCSILVNCAQRRPRAGRMFVIRTNHGLVVKRAGKDKHRWRLLSDHPAWKPVPWPADAEIIGEVKWAARTF